MDGATILVLVLSAGVIALLAWFEINSRRNDAKMESKSIPTPSSVESFNKKKSEIQVESDNQKRKVA